MVNPLGFFHGSNKSSSVTLSFRIPYYTHWGQHLLVCGSEPVLGSWSVKKGLLLSPSHQGDELIWSGCLSVTAGFACEYSYYMVDDERNVLRWEAGKKRKLFLPNGIQNGELIELHDLWQTGSDDLPLRSAFKDVIFRRSWNPEIDKPHGEIEKLSMAEDIVIVQFRICCPKIEKDSEIYVIGSSLKLGKWKIQAGLKLSYAGESVWQAESLMHKDDFPVQYRYCKYGKAGNFGLEIGSNRELFVDFSTSQPKYIVLSDGFMREMPWRGAGVAIPMFSVRSEVGLGVGEFLDLKLLVDWAVESGFHLVQLLPINDTSVHGMWWDSYPYSSLSVFALHPLYLRVQALTENISVDVKHEIHQAREQLDGKHVDYEATMAAKLSIAKKIYSQEREITFNSTAYQNFFSENQDWLKPYAAFCFLRDFFETSDHSQWGRFSLFSKDKLEKLILKDSLCYDIISFHYYIQFHLHKQLSESSEYARKKGVVLKGDLPIGVDRNSVDTWVYPNLFRMNTSTGAPPDYFDKNGQNWGFPTYNWEEMSKDNYAWWRTRLTQMAKYFTAYRIDHILGFFRIWELPDHAMTGLCGKFRPSIALSQEELEREGIWDFNRLSQPYIRQKLLQDMAYQSTYIKSLEKKLEKLKEHNYCLELDKDELERRAEHLRCDVQRYAHYLHEAEERNKKTQEEFETSQETVAEFIELRGDTLVEKIQILKDQNHQLVHQHNQYSEQTDAQIQELQDTVEVLSDQNAVLHGHIEHLEAVVANHEEEPEEDPEEEEEVEEDPMFEEKFGASWALIASNFLDECQKDHYEFKEDCNTEKKVASKLQSCIENSMLLESEEKLRRNLFDLLQNIVLIRDPEDSKKFYPRFNLEDTSSFSDLDEHSKNVMRRLYYDYYFRRQETLWHQNALKTLPVLLSSSDMLACGEDLGMIPSCVHPVMQELGLIGLRIQRMPNEPGLEFGIPSQYSYMTVCAPSCHDCSTLRAWWEEDQERRLRYFKTFVGTDLVPPDECTPDVARFTLRQHVEAPSMWSIFPLQDLLVLKEEYMTRPAVEETINDPTNPKHYWRYRVHVTLESLLMDKEHIASIKNLVQASGRSSPPLEDDDESQLDKSTTHLDTLQNIAETRKEETQFDSRVNSGISITTGP